MSNSDIISNIQDKFNELFNGKALLIESPGRINLIGEHTDYNEGFVMPSAIDKSIFLAMAENQEGIFRFY